MGGSTGRWWLVAGALLLLAVPSAALADGCFFKERRFAAPSPTPAQRALIIHRDGVERLVVESTAEPEGQTFGWILPLPAKPSSVEVATPGVLDTLDLFTRPRIESRGSWLEVLLPAGLVFLLVMALRLYDSRRKGSPTIRGTLEVTVVALLLLGLLAVVAIPNLQAGRLGPSGADIPGVASSEPRRVGNYEVTVLEAKDASALGSWLEKNGLSGLPPAGFPIVDSCIARGWVFLAARLEREGAGPATPHPLSVTFPSAKPIYPMRLTALAGGTTDLRLHVVANGSAACAPLDVRFSGRLEVRESPLYGFWGEAPRSMLASGSSWDGRGLAHPGLHDLLWSGCVVTRLEGSMTSAAMDRDLEFDIGPLEEYTHVLYTPRAAWLRAAKDWSWVWMVALLVLLLFSDGRLASLGASGSPFLRWILVATAAFGAFVTILRFTLPTIPAVNVVAGGNRTPFQYSEPLWRLLHESDVYTARPLPEVRSLLEGKLRDGGLRNPYTGRPLRQGDSPGDFDLVEDHRGPVVRVRSLEGAVLELPWFTERIEGILYHRNDRIDATTIVDARRLLFPAGDFTAGLRNPFTGSPVREDRSPGNAELVEEDGKVRLRAWFREGNHEDFPLR